MNEPIKIEEWIVTRSHCDLRRVAVVMGAGSSPAIWLAKLRRVLPRLEKRTPTELLAEVRECGRIDLGIVEGREAWKLGEVLRKTGYELEVVDASRVGYSATRLIDGVRWFRMDDDEEGNEAFCLELIERGARVEEPVQE